MAIIDGLKTAGDVLRKADKIEEYQQILAAQDKMLEMQKRIIDLEGENRTLRDKMKIGGKLCFERNAYWSSEEGKEDGPFCSGCWDRDQKLIRMHSTNGDRIFFKCPSCETFIQTGPFQAIIEPTEEGFDRHALI